MMRKAIKSGKLAALKMFDEIGISDISEISLELLVAGRGAILVEKELSNSEGRIVFGRKKSIITINSKIEFEGKRRFVIAHELGHHEMHRNLIPIHRDNAASLDYFKDGSQETEANEFASELLMPEKSFINACKGNKFSPDLLRSLSEQFKTSITSVAYKYFELGSHPICLVYSYNNKVGYWKRPENYPHFIKDRTRLAPPDGSVASEFFDTGKIYPKSQSKQRIWKSDWFEVKNWENDQDTNFYEYCIVTKKYNTVLSVIWEELK